MSGFYGADTDALRTLADRFAENSRRLEELRSTLTPVVTNADAWHGPDGDSFREQWSGSVVPRWGSVVDGISERDRGLQKQAEEQDHVSEPDGENGKDGDSFWDKIWKGSQALSKALGVYKALTEDLPKSIDDLKRLWNAWKMGPDDFSRVWESLKLRNKMEWASKGFEKLFNTIGGQLTDKIPSQFWEKLGGAIDEFPTKLAEGGRLVEKIGAKLGPEGIELLSKSSKVLGKFLPGVDIAVGALQIAKADDGYGKVSGALSVAGGALLLAGIAFPPLAVVGGVLTAVSLGMDLVDLGGELFDHDPSKAISDAVSHGVESAKNAASHAVDSVKDTASDALSSMKHGLGSIF